MPTRQLIPWTVWTDYLY